MSGWPQEALSAASARGSRQESADDLFRTELRGIGFARPPGARAGVLQLDKDHVRRRVADVLSMVLLRRQPAHRLRLKLHFALHLSRNQAPAKGTQRVHDTVGVRMWRRPVAGLIRVLKDTDLLVLEDDLVVLRIRDRRIEAHAMSMPARAHAGI